MKRNLVFAFSLLLLAASLSAAPTSAPGADALPLPATGTFIDATGGTGTFRGTFYVTKFAVAEDALVARGLLSGTLVSSTGVTLGSVMKSVSIPVTNAGGSAAAGVAAMAVGATATCDVLHLELGPLDLDLLGLVVHLDQIVLDIDAESGGGNLLGNLLCAVVGLLDGAGALADIANYLNQILDILSGLLG